MPKFSETCRWPILPLLGLIAFLWIQPGAALSQTSTDSGRTGFAHPAWSENAGIYEVNLRQFTPEGTLKAFQEQLPRLRDLGVEILWFMPIHPIGEVNRKGSLGSYYSVRDYRAVNPEFGSLDDLKSVIQAAHGLEMYVILDWVANHTAWDNPLATEHPEWYTRDDSGRFISPVPDWHDVIDLNYNHPGLRNYMIEAMAYWVREADVDGLRCDVAGMVPYDFWSEARRALDQIKPVFMLAEDETPLAHEHGFDMTYSWELFRLMAAIAKGDSNTAALDLYFAREALQYPPEAFRMRFTDNHDENSWNGTVRQRFGDGAAAFAVLCGTMPGMPLIYSGQEAGLNKRLEFFDRDPIPWQNHPLRDVYQKLFELKRENRALWNGTAGGDMRRIVSGNDTVYTFVRSKGDQAVMVAVNLSSNPQTIRLGIEDSAGEYRDYFSGQPFRISPNMQVNLTPWGYRVWAR